MGGLFNKMKNENSASAPVDFWQLTGIEKASVLLNDGGGEGGVEGGGMGVGVGGGGVLAK